MVLGLFVYILGIMTSLSDTWSATFLSRVTYSRTGASLSAEQGPITRMNLSLLPEKTAFISLSLFSFIFASSSEMGYISFTSFGIGSFLLNSMFIFICPFVYMKKFIYQTKRGARWNISSFRAWFLCRLFQRRLSFF